MYAKVEDIPDLVGEGTEGEEVKVPVETPEPPKKEEEAKKPEVEAKEEEKAKPKGGFQRKIDRQHKEIKERDERIAALEAQLAGKEVPRETSDDEPKETDFAEYKDYVKAVTRWELRQEMKRAEEEETETSQQEHAKETFEKYNERLAQAEAKYDDWDEMVEVASGITIPQSAQVCIIEAENGPDVVYYLAKNPEMAKKLAEMSDARQAVEIGRISAKLEGSEVKEEATKKPKSNAPPPIDPVGGHARSEVNVDNESIEDYIVRKNKEAREARRF